MVPCFTAIGAVAGTYINVQVRSLLRDLAMFQPLQSRFSDEPRRADPFLSHTHYYTCLVFVKHALPYSTHHRTPLLGLDRLLCPHSSSSGSRSFHLYALIFPHRPRRRLLPSVLRLRPRPKLRRRTSSLRTSRVSPSSAIIHQKQRFDSV